MHERAIKTIEKRIEGLRGDIEFRKHTIARLISEQQTGLEEMENAIKEYETALERLKQ